ncbi:unnamed protein product [Rhizophagus irregularis]|nr:unnamed protein product [Rhizophagus irregularis]
MAERVDLRIRRTVQNETNNHTLRKEGREGKRNCFGGVFIWEDTFQMAYPLGGSLEEARNNPIEGIAWFVENGIVYEYIKKPQHIYTDTKE